MHEGDVTRILSHHIPTIDDAHSVKREMRILALPTVANYRWSGGRGGGSAEMTSLSRLFKIDLKFPKKIHKKIEKYRKTVADFVNIIYTTRWPTCIDWGCVRDLDFPKSQDGGFRGRRRIAEALRRRPLLPRWKVADAKVERQKC